MTEKMLQRQLTRYRNDAIRYKKWADRYYAAWKESENIRDYIYSQNYYKAAERATSIRKKYELQLKELNNK